MGKKDCRNSGTEYYLHNAPDSELPGAAALYLLCIMITCIPAQKPKGNPIPSFLFLCMRKHLCYSDHMETVLQTFVEWAEAGVVKVSGNSVILSVAPGNLSIFLEGAGSVQIFAGDFLSIKV